MRLFQNNSIFTPKNSSDNLFLVIDQLFLISPFSFQIVRVFTVLNVVYDPFFTRKTTASEKNSLTRHFFFTLFVLLRASDNNTSQNIGETDAWASPHLKFGGPSPQSLLGLRPCLQLGLIIYIGENNRHPIIM